MNLWKQITKGRTLKTVAIGTVLAVATVAPGGAFVAGAGSSSAPQLSGTSFEAFVSALADEVVSNAIPESSTEVSQGEVKAAVQEAVHAAFESNGNSTQVTEAEVVQQVTDSVDQVGNVDLPQLPDFSNSNSAEQAQQQAAPASTTDVINALLALLTSAQPQVMAALDTAEAAVIAKLDAAKAQVIAATTQANMPEIQAFAIQQIDAAKVLIGQAFDWIRAMVVAAFNEARDRIIEELTGIDFGDAVDEVLADIAEIQGFVTQMLGNIQNLLEELGGALPLP